MAHVCILCLMVACSLRRAPKNYPSDGNFAQASCDNVERTVIKIFGRKILPEHLEHSQAIEPSMQMMHSFNLRQFFR